MHEQERQTPGGESSREPDLGALLSQAVACHQAGRLSEAEQLYRAVLKRHPGQFDGLHLLGVIHHQRGAFKEAVRQIDAALTINPDVAAAHCNRASALLELRRFEEAIAGYDRAIALKADYAEAFCCRGSALVQMKRFDEALADCDRAVALKPDLAEAFSNRGNALKDLRRLDEALASYARAIALKPGFAEAHNNRANALNQLFRSAEALASAERAIALKPHLAQAHYNRGIALERLRRHADALASFDAAIALRPDYAEAWFNRGGVCLDLGRGDDAAASYARAMALDPEVEDLRGMHLYAKMLVCDWTNFAEERERLAGAVADGKAASPPFQLLAFAPDPALQLEFVTRWCARRLAPPAAALWRGEIYSHPRIRLAYLSADFRNHPVSLLTAGVFERHDRGRFETTAISYGPDTPSPVRARLKQAFDRFIDADAMTDAEVAGLMRDLEIDIAVDLNGITDGARAGVLALRPAPVHVNHLGYAGTLGRSPWDYIIADRFVVPPGSEAHYGEAIARLPDCFMPNDCGRSISARTPSRADAGLPDEGFVFCSFNNAYKITPDVFDVWMRLLGAIEGSVLWLSLGHASAIGNLRRAAEECGVSSDRLRFAPKVPSNPDHLARLRLADLFLDTFPYNAHATAADALWAGVPVVTCAGTTFASRVAGSLLHAAGLPGLVTASVADYEARALALAREPRRLAAARAALARNRDTCPLFDTARFTRHLEAAYTAMRERTRRGEPPCSFAVEALDPT